MCSRNNSMVVWVCLRTMTSLHTSSHGIGSLLSFQIHRQSCRARRGCSCQTLGSVCKVRDERIVVISGRHSVELALDGIRGSGNDGSVGLAT